LCGRDAESVSPAALADDDTFTMLATEGTPDEFTRNSM